jgi:hypothetical protein
MSPSYIAALAPDADETSKSQQDKFPRTDVFSRVDVADGRAWMRRDGVECFAGDLPPEEQALVWATHQAPVADLFNQKVPGTAWKSKPSWYVIGKKDRTVHPELQRFVSPGRQPAPRICWARDSIQASQSLTLPPHAPCRYGNSRVPFVAALESRRISTSFNCVSSEPRRCLPRRGNRSRKLRICVDSVTSRHSPGLSPGPNGCLPPCGAR